MSGTSPTIPGAPKSKNHVLWIILVVILCVPVLFVGSFLAAPLIAIHRADAGFRQAKRTIDPEHLRNWALEEISKYPITNEALLFREIPRSEIPKEVQNLYSIPPEGAAVMQRETDGKLYVKIAWGGGFFQWFFTVGSTNFLRTTNPGIAYQMAEWTPGVYYSREGNRFNIR